MTAHYFATKGRKYVVIANGASITLASRVAEIAVSGKAEARKIATQYNAKCRNF